MHEQHHFQEYVDRLHRFAEEHMLTPDARKELYGIAAAFLEHGAGCYSRHISDQSSHLPFTATFETESLVREAIDQCLDTGLHHLERARQAIKGAIETIDTKAALPYKPDGSQQQSL